MGVVTIEFLVTWVYYPPIIILCSLLYAEFRGLLLRQWMHLENTSNHQISFQASILSGHKVSLMISTQESVPHELSWMGPSWSTWLIPGRLWWKILCWVPEVTQRNAHVSTLEKYHLHSSSKLFWKCPSEEFMPDPIKVMVIKSGKMTQMARKNHKMWGLREILDTI